MALPLFAGIKCLEAYPVQAVERKDADDGVTGRDDLHNLQHI